MLTAQDNARITQTGPATPCGRLMRRYWQPAALLDELDGPRPVRGVRLLGEDFVLLREPSGRIGLLDRHCAHRGADLAFGRCEDGGLRCPFHGWLFDAAGTCLDQPAEPPDSTFRHKVRQPAYPCVVRGGIVWAWLGDGEPPAFPPFDCFEAPDSHTFAFKGRMDCNWLQALEVGIDPAHASYLHRFFDDGAAGDAYGQQFRGSTVGADIPMTRLLREFGQPRIDVETTGYGLRIAALRPLDAASTHVRVTNMVMPHGFVIPMSREMTITQWHVPIDDTHCYWYAIFTSFAAPVDRARMRAQRLALYTLPDYVPRIGAHNGYGFDADEQSTRTYTGMGDDINVHDQWAVESMGPIQDRTREHLGSSDRAIIACRRMLFAAMDDVAEGRAPKQMAAGERGPGTIDTIAPTGSWEADWRARDADRRCGAPWRAAALLEA